MSKTSNVRNSCCDGSTVVDLAIGYLLVEFAHLL